MTPIDLKCVSLPPHYLQLMVAASTIAGLADHERTEQVRRHPKINITMETDGNSQSVSKAEHSNY